MKKLFLVIASMLVISGSALAADMTWNYPADWDIIDGWTVYYTDGTEAYNKTLYKTDVTHDGTTVTWQDVDDKLNLAYETEHLFTLRAFNNSAESGPSNEAQYTRAAYSPPVDVLPPPVPGGAGDPSGLGVQ